MLGLIIYILGFIGTLLFLYWGAANDKLDSLESDMAPAWAFSAAWPLLWTVILLAAAWDVIDEQLKKVFSNDKDDSGN